MKIEKDITQEVVEEFIHRRFSIDCNWTTGNCFFFAKILESTFPTYSRIYYDVIYGHFVCWINGNFYDWNGKIEDNGVSKYIPWDLMEEYDVNEKRRIIRDCIL